MTTELEQKIINIFKSRGDDVESLLNDKRVYKVKYIDRAATMIMKAVRNQQHIHIVADYDCDGIMSGSILALVMCKIGAEFSIRFPKRISEGYGISQKILDEIPNNSLLITVDNGITAVEVVDAAKNRGMSVIILDHHQTRDDGLLPKADCLVDPHIYEGDEFKYYCGAGLSFMLAKTLKVDETTINKANVFAMIATIQDSVPLIGDNRNIVKRGLLLLNQRAVKLSGLYALCDAMNLTSDKITEDEIAFQIGPCVNAMGRMFDNGAAVAYNTLMHYSHFGDDGIQKMVDCNTSRKNQTNAQQTVVEMVAERIVIKETTCVIVYVPKMNEGLIGINAAQLSDKYNMPAIVFTDSENGLLKGSARSVEGINIKHALDCIPSHLIAQYGGHHGAAGISIAIENLKDFTIALNQAIPHNTNSKNTLDYDIEITENEIERAYQIVKKYAPYGEGFKPPVFKITNYTLQKKYGKVYRTVGKNGIVLNSKYNAVSFTLKDKFCGMKTNHTLNLVGTIGFSNYDNSIRISINDMEAVDEI